MYIVEQLRTWRMPCLIMCMPVKQWSLQYLNCSMVSGLRLGSVWRACVWGYPAWECRPVLHFWKVGDTNSLIICKNKQDLIVLAWNRLLNLLRYKHAISLHILIKFENIFSQNSDVSGQTNWTVIKWYENLLFWNLQLSTLSRFPELGLRKWLKYEGKSAVCN